MRNVIIVAVIAALLFAAAGFLAWRHFTQLTEQISGLGTQVENLGQQAAAAEERARTAEERAGEANDSANEAADRAEEARERELQSFEEARQAEDEAARAAADRATALQKAEEDARARQAAEEQKAQEEERRLAAEKKAEEAVAAVGEAEAEARRVRAKLLEIERRREEELGRLQRTLGRIAETRRTALGVVLSLDGSKVEFDFNKAELRPENREVLSKIVGVLLTFENFGLQVFGHTDDVGSEEYNQTLSEQRAQAVYDYLVESGIDPSTMSAQGFGKSSPLVEGTDPESRQRNRRVELAITFSDDAFGSVVSDEEGANGG